MSRTFQRAVFAPCRAVLGAMVMAAALASPSVIAAEFPSRPVTIVVPFAAGGGSDITARLVAKELADLYGKPFVVENKPGASTQIATRFVINAEPDGHTLLLATTSLVNNAHLYKNLPYDASKSLRPVVPLVDVPAFLAVGTALKAQTAAEFIQEARALSDKGALNFGSAGTASTLHLAGEWFNQSLKLNAIHVPYKGSGPAVVALAAGEVGYSFENLGPALPQMANGRVRLLAIAGPERFPTLPDVPPLKDFGLPDTDVASWFVLVAPVDTPDAVVNDINQKVNQILQRPEIRQRILELGFVPTGGSAQALAERMRSDSDKWVKIIEAGKVTVTQ